MPGTYAYNQTILVRGRFYDEAGQPTDPPGVSLKVRTPSGVVATHLFTDPSTPIVRVSEGIYTAIVKLNQSGRWSYAWWPTAPSPTGSQPSEEGYVDVKPSAFE